MARMKDRIKRKVHSCRGFTLAETLLAVLILLLVSVILATGIPAAKSAYEKVVVASNADVLLSTTMTTLRNELGTARDVEVKEDGTTITYYNPTRGTSSQIFLKNDSIMFQRYDYKDIEINVEGVDLVAKPLIPPKMATEDLLVTYDFVSFDAGKGIITFHNLSVNRAGTTGLASREKLSIRVISN